YKQSLQYLQSAEILNEKIQDHFLSFEICRVRSRLYSSMYLLDAAIREQKKRLALIPTIERPLRDKKYLASLAYENLVVTFNNLSQKDSSFFYLQKNKALIENQESSFFSYNQITLYSMLGAYYTDVGNFSEAEL